MEAFHFPEAMQNNFALYPLSRIVSTSNRTKTILTIRERTALRHQRNHHWVNYLKTLHILNHPTPPPFFLPSPNKSRKQHMNPVSFNPVTSSRISRWKISQSPQVRSLVVPSSLKYFTVYQPVLLQTPYIHSLLTLLI